MKEPWLNENSGLMQNPVVNCNTRLSQTNQSQNQTFPFPRFRQPEFLYVVEAGDKPLEIQLMLLTLQGIINRVQPRIYLILPRPGRSINSDWFWLQNMVDNFNVTYELVDDPFWLIDTFKSEINGVVIWDPEFLDTTNIALPLCGLNNWVAASPSLATNLQDHGLVVMEDLRGRWSNPQQIYSWAFENLWPKCNQNMLASNDPNYGHPQRVLWLGGQDYIVANNIFTFYLYPYGGPETDLLVHILENTPRNIPVYGGIHWASEHTETRLFSQYGKSIVVTQGVSNLSVHAGVKVSLPLEPPRNEDSPLNIRNKIYVSFIWSDGNAPTHTLHRMKELWDQDPRGTFPVGWGVFDIIGLAPAVLWFYYKNATKNDYFVAMPTSYRYEPIYPEPLLDELLTWDKNGLDRIGLDILWLLCPTNVMHDLVWTYDLLLKFVRKTNPKGIFLDFQTHPQPEEHYYFIENTPIVPACYWSTTATGTFDIVTYSGKVKGTLTYSGNPVKDTLGWLKDLAQRVRLRPFFLFVGVDCWRMDMLQLKEIVDNLGEDFEVVSPDRLLSMMVPAIGAQFDYVRQEIERANKSISHLERCRTLVQQSASKFDLAELSYQSGNLNETINHLINSSQLLAQAWQEHKTLDNATRFRNTIFCSAITLSLLLVIGKFWRKIKSQLRAHK